MNKRMSTFIFIWLMVFIFSGCQAPQTIPTFTPTPTINPTTIPQPSLSPTITITSTSSHTPLSSLGSGVEIVSIPVSDDINLSGTIYHAKSDTLVIFAHMGGYDQTSWAEFAQEVADNRISAFTYDIRCHGKSECFGISTDSKNYKDLITVMEFLRQRGYKYFVCVGASLGGAACNNISLREELAGLVLIASVKQFAFETKSFPQDLVSPDMPKMFIYNENDHYKVIRTAMPDLYNQAPEPKSLQVFPGQYHGTEMFKSPYADQISETLLNFLLRAILE